MMALNSPWAVLTKWEFSWTQPAELGVYILFDRYNLDADFLDRVTS